MPQGPHDRRDGMASKLKDPEANKMPLRVNRNADSTGKLGFDLDSTSIRPGFDQVLKGLLKGFTGPFIEFKCKRECQRQPKHT